MFSYFKNISSTMKNAWIVTFTVFLDLFGFGIIIPIIPHILINPLSDYYAMPFGITLGTSYIILGLLTATFPLAQFISTPILGKLSDRFGRKPVLFWSALGTTIAYMLIAFAVWRHSITLLFIARFIDGLTGGNISVAQASIADITSGRERARLFGYIGAAFGLGLILGPAVGGILSKVSLWSIGLSLPFLLASFLSLVNVLLVFFIFKETLDNEHRDHHYIFKPSEAFSHIKKAFAYPKLGKLFTVKFLFDFGFSCFTTFFSVFLAEQFLFDQEYTGYLYASIGIFVVLGQTLIEHLIPKRYSDKERLYVAMPLTLLSMLLFLVPKNSVWLFIISPFFAIGIGMSMVHLYGIISRMGTQKQQGEIIGLAGSMQALGQTIPPIISGFFAYGLSSEFPLIVGSLIIFIGWILYMREKKYLPKLPHEDTLLG